MGTDPHGKPGGHEAYDNQENVDGPSAGNLGRRLDHAALTRDHPCHTLFHVSWGCSQAWTGAPLEPMVGRLHTFAASEPYRGYPIALETARLLGPEGNHLL